MAERMNSTQIKAHRLAVTVLEYKATTDVMKMLRGYNLNRTREHDRSILRSVVENAMRCRHPLEQPAVSNTHVRRMYQYTGRSVISVVTIRYGVWRA